MPQSLDTTTRIASSSADAAAGYATAAVAAYVDLAGQMLGCWASAVDTMMGKSSEPKSWYRHPDRGASAGASQLGTWPWMAAWGSNTGFPGTNAAAFNPVSLWLKAWPLQGNPAAWPMAFAMMGMGVSRSVAYPLAEANTAAVDAMTTAGAALERTLASYRTDGGHAVAQILFKDGAALKSLIPIGILALAPWLFVASQGRAI